MILGGVKKKTYLQPGIVLYIYGLGGNQACRCSGLLTERVRPLGGGLVVMAPTTWESAFVASGNPAHGCRRQGTYSSTRGLRNLRRVKKINKRSTPGRHQVNVLTVSANSLSLEIMDAGNVLSGSYNTHDRYLVLHHPLKAVWKVPYADHPWLVGALGRSPNPMARLLQRSLAAPVD